ncbi:hypothetical protein, partial [Candidatus Bandiella numerosa]|uniref:hypothetical protein n=1 Tax=Candidatus Bandiella numerosa TaxID=2570586 RepID=UPI001F34F717
LPSASFRQLLTKLTLPQLMDSSISAHEGLEPSTLTSCTAHINTRFKRKQKMQWTRENAHNVLQIKATMSSNEWNLYEANIDN